MTDRTKGEEPPAPTLDDFWAGKEAFFNGAELAAAYWDRYHRNPFSARAAADLSPEIQAALDEIITYATGGLVGLDRHLKPEDALRRGFLMGYRFAVAHAAGELDGTAEDDEDDEASFEDLFRPQPPKGAH